MDRKVIMGFDIDSVALDYAPEVNRIFQLLGGKSDLTKGREFDHTKQIAEDERDRLFIAHGYLMNQELDEVPGFNLLLDLVRPEQTNVIQFITSRTKEFSKDSTYKSLDKVFVKNGYGSFYNVSFLGWENSKLNRVLQLGINVFFDDRRKTCLELSKNGIFCMMPAQSWNEIPENTPNIFRYNSCKEAVDYIKNNIM